MAGGSGPALAAPDASWLRKHLNHNSYHVAVDMCNAGDWSEQEALSRALETWPKGVRPVVHWSESQEGRRDSAHSDYIQGPMNLHGRERDVDVMVEAKCMERCLLRFRDWTLLGKTPPVKQEETGATVVNPASELAAKFL